MQSKQRIDYKKVKVLAKKNGLSFVELGNKIGIPFVTLYKALESPNPKLAYIEAIADYFGLKITDVITEDRTRWKERRN